MTDNTSAQDEIRFDVTAQVATITFNRPDSMNAMTWNMYDRLVEYCDEIDGDDSIRVAILTGAGDRAFVAGTDIGQFQAFDDPQDAINYELNGDRVSERLDRVRKPMIAMLRGFCVGGGAGIALSCDFRYTTGDLRFGIPIARTIGNCLSMRNYSRIVEYVGPARAKEMLMLARLLTAEEALAAGVVNEIVPDAELETRVSEVAERLTQLAPRSMAATKEAIRRIMERRAVESSEGTDLIVSCYMSDDFRNAVDAFVEKRRPIWTGQ